MPNTSEQQHKPPTRSFISPLISILLDSLRIIFLNHLKLFFFIYIFTALPLSLLLTSLSLFSAPCKARVAHLEWLAHVAPIWVESEHVRAEARARARSLLYYKALHAVPILFLSLISLTSSVTIIHCRMTVGRPIVIQDIFVSIKDMWFRPMLTCIVNYALQMGWTLVVDVVATVVGYPTSVAIVVVAVVVEVYLMAVLSLALVVSVTEEKVGVDAVRVGFSLMKGRRVCGWVLSGLILSGSGCIGWEMDGWDLRVVDDYWTVGVRVGYMVGIVGLLGWVSLWSYVVFTVFYFDCRRINVQIIS